MLNSRSENYLGFFGIAPGSLHALLSALFRASALPSLVIASTASATAAYSFPAVFVSSSTYSNVLRLNPWGLLVSQMLIVELGGVIFSSRGGGCSRAVGSDHEHPSSPTHRKVLQHRVQR